MIHVESKARTKSVGITECCLCHDSEISPDFVVTRFCTMLEYPTGYRIFTCKERTLSILRR